MLEGVLCVASGNGRQEEPVLVGKEGGEGRRRGGGGGTDTGRGEEQEDGVAENEEPKDSSDACEVKGPKDGGGKRRRGLWADGGGQPRSSSGSEKAEVLGRVRG